MASNLFGMQKQKTLEPALPKVGLPKKKPFASPAAATEIKAPSNLMKRLTGK